MLDKNKITPHKQVKIMLCACLLVLMCGTASATWWDAGWDHRTNVTISHVNASGSTLTNYPAMINISKEAAMQADFDDIRFVTAGGNPISFELEKPAISRSVGDFSRYFIHGNEYMVDGVRFWWLGMLGIGVISWRWRKR